MSNPFKGKRYDAHVMNPWAGTAAEKYGGQLDPFLVNIDTMRNTPIASKALSSTPEEDYLKEVQAFVESGKGPNSALWNLTAQRYMNALTPRLSGAGVLTSGPGIDVMQQGMENLATSFSVAERERRAAELGLLGTATAQQRKAYQDALQGLAVLETLPVEVRTKLIQILFAGQQPIPFTMTPSPLTQMGGGSGIADLYNAFSGGGGGGSGGGSGGGIGSLLAMFGM